AIRPYSIAVAPDSSFAKRAKMFIPRLHFYVITETSSFDTSHIEQAGRYAGLLDIALIAGRSTWRFALKFPMYFRALTECVAFYGMRRHPYILRGFHQVFQASG